MTRYVIGPDVAVRLAREEAVIRGVHQLLAPALLRSQVLSLVYQAVRRGEMTSKQAERQLEYVRGLRMRPLGDHVLQDVARKAAGLLGWADTSDAEYVALTQLQLTCLRAWAGWNLTTVNGTGGGAGRGASTRLKPGRPCGSCHRSGCRRSARRGG